MTTAEKTQITVQATVNAPADKVWKYWTGAEHIIKWCSPSPEWHTPKATHDVVPGGKFTFRMEAKDGSQGFDFGGTYNEVKPGKFLSYTMDDGRVASITFTQEGNATKLVETFDPENQNPIEMQRAGWQAIMDNFKSYTESN